MKTDVLVVGAGPVGLTLAAELTRYGLSVRLVEKLAQATDKSKALVLWSRTLELLDRLGCTPSLLNQGFKVTEANVFAGEKQIAHVTLNGVDTPYPFALMIPQSDTERLLAENLNSRGVTVERNVELLSFKKSSEGVHAILRHLDGREESVESSWLVGCDGAHSTVRHQLGMEFEGNTLKSDWILADVHLHGVPHPGTISIMWHAEGVLVLFPISDERYRVIADAGIATSEKRRPDPTMEEIQTILDQRGPGQIQASAPVWLAAFRINERKVTDYRSGPVFLAGDAAHIHSPAGGQGMNTGMQDAINLAWKLASVHRGLCSSPCLLDSYSQERSAVGDQVLKAAGRITMIGTLRGGIKQSIRNHVATLVMGLAPMREAMANVITEISIGYSDSLLNEQGALIQGGPKAGQRAPIRIGETPVGAGPAPRFSLFAGADEKSAAFLREYPDLVDGESRPPFHEGGMWLVRPDGYVGVATKQGDWDRVRSYLKKLKTG